MISTERHLPPTCELARPARKKSAIIPPAHLSGSTPAHRYVGCVSMRTKNGRYAYSWRRPPLCTYGHCSWPTNYCTNLPSHHHLVCHRPIAVNRKWEVGVTWTFACRLMWRVHVRGLEPFREPVLTSRRAPPRDGQLRWLPNRSSSLFSATYYQKVSVSLK